MYSTGWASRRYFSAGFIDGELQDAEDLVPWKKVSLSNMVYTRTDLPKDAEMIAEISDAVEAVCTAKNIITAMELGSACGPQLGHLIAFNLRSKKLPMKLVAVEGDNSKIDMLRQNLVDNGADLNDVTIYNAACHTRDGFVQFTSGGSNGDYGTHVIDVEDPHILSAGDSTRKNMTNTIPSVNVCRLMMQHEVIDYMHFDIQGSEHKVVPACMVEFNKRVRLVNIGIHSGPTEKMLIKLFHDNGWNQRYLYSGSTSNPANPSGISNSTFGTLGAQDGSGSWYNPRFEDYTPCTKFMLHRT